MARTSTAPRPVAIARGLFGVALLVAPERVLRSVPHRQVDDRAVVVARILGARHLLEAGMIGRRRGEGWIALGAAIDGIHATTAIAYGALDSRHRPAAWTNAASAALFAGAGLHELWELRGPQRG